MNIKHPNTEIKPEPEAVIAVMINDAIKRQDRIDALIEKINQNKWLFFLKYLSKISLLILQYLG